MKINQISPETGIIEQSGQTNILDYIGIKTGSVTFEDLINLSKNTEIVFNRSDINENAINKARLLHLQREFTNTLINYIKEENFEYGYNTKADLLIEKYIKINSFAVKEWLNTLFIDNYNIPEIAIGILRLVSRFDIDVISPEGKTMAIAALAHSNLEVKESGIRAFEAWNSLETIDILKTVTVKEDWLKEYLLKVIENIEIEYAVADKETK
jgi:hypothetical protein